MKIFLASILSMAIFTTTMAQKNSIHQFKVTSIDGKTLDLSKFKGKKILIVNTASECGYTPQYEGLQKLYDANKDKLVIIGFPCNQFGGQEPGSEESIKEFCKARFGVTFPLTAKVNVKGDNISPVYKWLCNKAENGVLDATIKWNFNKFLLDENGIILAYFPSKTKPDSEEIINLLK
ncbi:MAG: glutathione peroxidase [Chitinophagaceae bacterium]|nr:glutathione peroxidase [Chitinophagaceae bacterium]